MSATALIWAALAIFLLVKSFSRASWAVALYMLTFFAAPHLWWWGTDLPRVRYAYISGFVLLAAVIWQKMTSTEPDAGKSRRVIVHTAAFALVANAIFVHVALASSRVVSFLELLELLKFTLLFFLIAASIKDRTDLRIVLMAITLGAGYLGYEVTINERGGFSGSRLEGVGAPGADTSNDLACLMLLALPLIGSLFVGGSRLTMVIVTLAAPLTLNVILLCNSRGAFLGLVGGGVVFFLLSRGPTRKIALRTLVLGSLALYLLLGDPKILDRFATTFVGAEERDASAAGRIEFWHAGFLMLLDYPLGAGGGAFKWVYASTYLARIGSSEPPRSLHNAYLTEATDWGVQGLLIKLVFVGGAIMLAYRTSKQCRLANQPHDALVGICFVVSAAGFLIVSVFGAFFSDEWLYWLVALLVRYSQIYEAPAAAVAIEASRVPEMYPAARGAALN